VNYVIWQVLTVVAMKFTILVDVAPCSLVITSILEDNTASTFRVQKCRRLGIKMEDYYKTVICVYHNTLRHITLQRNANLHRDDNS
jgi:hypothetical protein